MNRGLIPLALRPLLPPTTLLLLFCLATFGCSGAVHRVERGILRGEILWEGRVEIDGVVMVDRGAHLRIAPGTEVVFLGRDDDGDGIGDGQLNVHGRLTAVGSRERPILFRAAEAGKKGWTFLHLSGREKSRLRFCLFRDAFTGLQLHYVEADVAYCLFIDNHEGMRYSTIRGRIAHNTFQGNGVGLRFEGRRSAVVVEYNLFRENDVNVFPVTEGGREDRFRHNDFLPLRYNVRLGLEQSGDLDFSHNYWGTNSREELLEGIYDGRDDPSLGRVEFEPFLLAPSPGAGASLPLPAP